MYSAVAKRNSIIFGKFSLVSARVCRGGVGVFSLGSSFFICFFRQKATIVFHSLKAKVFLCVVMRGKGQKHLLVNNVGRSFLISCFNVRSSFSSICLFNYFSDVFGRLWRVSMFPGALLANVYILKNLVGSCRNLKGLIHLIFIMFVRR